SGVGVVPFYSTVTGGVLDMAGLDAGYWYRNLRFPVRFEETVRVLLDAGFRQFVEVSAHPVLTLGVEQTA
ncbi:acyltransferase domain-containing protein, partial [Streptomyces malaysiensis]|nr:acyltransferase domain-containing protein [Streptomyces malaysiensis]